MKPNNPHNPEFKFSSIFNYSIPVGFAMICYSIPSNLDVILVKYFFSATDAGIYTSISVLGKIIFFFPAAIGTVSFPMVVEKFTRGEDTINILIKSIFYTMILAGFVLMIYILFPQQIINVFGHKYLSGVSLIIPYGMAMFFFSMVIVIMRYYLAIKDMKYITFFVLFTILETLLLFMFHSSTMEMVHVLLWVNLIFLLSSLLYTWKIYSMRNMAMRMGEI